MEYVAINIFLTHLFLKDVYIVGHSEFFRTFEALNSGYRRAARKAGR